MSSVTPPSDEARSSWDALIAELQAQRERVGSPSYGYIAEQIEQDRIRRGAPEYAARIARSTVYDAFRLGRSRVNLPLMREIGQALGATSEEVEGWIKACSDPVASGTLTLVSDDPPLPDPSAKQVGVLLLACLLINIVGRVFVDFFALPIYLDMVGTAIAAIALGPWRGAALGLVTNVVCVIGSGWVSLPFALVNIAGALVWGYGVKSWGMGKTFPRFFTLNVVVALVCSVVAVPILAFVVGDSLRAGHDSITELIGDAMNAYWVALPFSNILTSTWDKLISGFAALAVVTVLPITFHKSFRLARVLRDASTS